MCSNECRSLSQKLNWTNRKCKRSNETIVGKTAKIFLKGWYIVGILTSKIDDSQLNRIWRRQSKHWTHDKCTWQHKFVTFQNGKTTEEINVGFLERKIKIPILATAKLNIIKNKKPREQTEKKRRINDKEQEIRRCNETQLIVING